MVRQRLSQFLKAKNEFMTYYNELITEKSWRKLQELQRKHKFILIGGWAVYVYARMLKSKDIDFICDYEELEKLRLEYDLVKNERLKKYEIHVGEFDIDIYTPFFSDLGIPPEDIMQLCTHVEGFTVPTAEALLILKQKAYENRSGSSKGEKDRIDIIALLNSVDFEKYKLLLEKYSEKKFLSGLIQILKTTRQVPELNMGEHVFSNFKKEILKKIE